MVNTADNTILLKVSEPSPHLEGLTATDGVYPGYLLEEFSGGLRPHQSSYTAAAPIFAYENIYKGQTIYDPYNSGDRIMSRYCRPGDVVLSWVTTTDLAGEDISVGEFLASNGTGLLHSVNDGVVQPGGIVGAALEAITLVTDQVERIRIRVF